MQKANLETLIAARVPFLIGTDGKADGAVTETQYLVGLGVVDAASVLRLLSFDTPRYIFPQRWIGAPAPGYEASFVTLAGTPAVAAATLGSVSGYAKDGILPKAPGSTTDDFLPPKAKGH